MLVREAMTKNVRVIDPNETIEGAARIMRKEKIGALIVTKENDEVLGMITEGTIVRDVVASGKSTKISVSEVMIKNPLTIHPDRTLEEAADLMQKKRVKRLPVVEDDAIVGIITTTDLIAYEEKLVEKLAEMFIKEKSEIGKETGEIIAAVGK